MPEETKQTTSSDVCKTRITCNTCQHQFIPTVAEIMVPCRPRITSIEVDGDDVIVKVTEEDTIANTRTDMAASDNFFFDCPECGETIESPFGWTIEIEEE